MSLADFTAAPSKQRHDTYDNSMLSGVAPEYSTGEVLLASAYRRLLLGTSEARVDLASIEAIPGQVPPDAGGSETWKLLVLDRGGLASPFRARQSGPTAPRQLMPLVPSVANFAGVLGRQPRSRWNPSNLLLDVIGCGLGEEEGKKLVSALSAALAVGPDDDVFARFAEEALRTAWIGVKQDGDGLVFPRDVGISDTSRRAFHPSILAVRTPAERFCRDVGAVIELKPRLTRRQWVVLVEALLRLGLGMHALWMCRLNDVVFSIAGEILEGKNPPSPAEIEQRAWPTSGAALLELGASAWPPIVHHVERYAYARTGINMLLHMLDDASASWPAEKPLGFAPGRDAAVALKEFFDHLAENRDKLQTPFRASLGALFDDSKELRMLARGKAGYTNNLREFIRHALGQIEARVADERSYDLTYLLSSSKKRELNVQPGPDLLIMLVHVCCANNPQMPVSLDDFRAHLGAYGLRVPAGELVDGPTGRALTRLGLVVDSPDAAGGSLLVAPFD